MRKRNIPAVLLALLALVAAGFLLYSIPNEPRNAQRLPDGSHLRIVHFEYGHSHQYSLPKLKPWQRFLGKHLPASMTARFGLREGEASVGHSARPGESDLAIITVCEKANPKSFYRPKLRIFDEHGNECGVARPSATSDGPDRKLILWSIDSAPTDKKLVLKFTETGPDGLTRELATFHLPNPAAGK